MGQLNYLSQDRDRDQWMVLKMQEALPSELLVSTCKLTRVTPHKTNIDSFRKQFRQLKIGSVAKHFLYNLFKTNLR
jgi:hypothetical protein